MAQSLTAVGENIHSVETIAKFILMLTDVEESKHFEDFLWGIQKNEIGKCSQSWVAHTFYALNHNNFLVFSITSHLSSSTCLSAASNFEAIEQRSHEVQNDLVTMRTLEWALSKKQFLKTWILPVKHTISAFERAPIATILLLCLVTQHGT